MRDVRTGDTFIFRGERVEAKEVARDVCGAGKVHINNNSCFEAMHNVTVVNPPEEKEQDA